MQKPLVTSPRVRPGDTVAVVSPSFGAVGVFPHRVERARGYLESLWLKVQLMPNAAGVDGWVSAPAEARAEDIHQAFLDEDVAVVLAGIGGNHSNQVLTFLDYDLIREHPKVFQGYSDITVLHWAFLRHAGLATFHGPALVPELGEYPQVLPFTDRFLRAAWFGSEPIVFEASEEWTDELLDWREKQDLTRPRELRPSEGWITVRGGVAEGWLLDGCLETVCWHLKGSAAWIDPADAVLFLETSEETPSPAHVDAYLTDLEQLGVFDAVAGLFFGRPYGYDEERAKVLWEVVAERTEAAAIPVLANVDLGHTDPMLTVPLGATARLDADARRLKLLEPSTTDRA
jgi:muramoyltetrapeptide carboxypeptidase LdcA involved in peptidoglycan recycling